MELRLQPKPLIDIEPASKGLVSREKFFVKKSVEKINEYFFPAHFMRTWRPKVELLYTTPSDETSVQYECDFNRNIQNCFVEDFAEEIYLKTPPPCFVVLGKSDATISKLSQKIALEYGSVLIEVHEVVDQILRSNNETGIFLDKVLRLGVSVTFNFLLGLVSYLAHTAEARHRGYVLCGFPCLPIENDLPVEEQINYLFCWENKPTIFVHVSHEDEDLIRSRSRVRYGVQSVENGDKTLLIPHFPSVGIEEKNKNNLTSNKDYNDEDDEGDKNKSEVLLPESDVNICPSQPWIYLPQNEEPQVWLELESFDKIIKPAIDLLISRIDPQYVINVDSRVGNEFEIVQSRLMMLNIWKSPIPFPFIPLKNEKNNSNYENEFIEDTDEEAGEVKYDNDILEFKKLVDKSPEIAFLTFFSKKTISPKFQWELSHYNNICPVSLRAGEVTEGKSEFAVVFMKYIYFLRDEESMKLFLKNPRPYVLPVKPKPPSRFFIIGYPYCGKTTLAQSLAQEFSIPIINLDQVTKNDLEQKKDSYMEFCRQKAELQEMQRLTTQAWRDWRLEEEQRVSLIEDWIGYIQSLLEHRIERFYSKNIEPENPNKTHKHSIQNKGESDDGNEDSTDDSPEGLEIRGISVGIIQNIDDPTWSDNYSTPSTKIIQALKHEDYDFDKKGFEVEANLFFSALWNSFTRENEPNEMLKSYKEKYEEEYGEDASKMSIAGEDITESNTSLNWCALLPPQSLSSLLLQKGEYTNRRRRQSFRILLAAASKAYWDSSSLKLEFAKWRLPCYMDIPLCEIFVDNPTLVYKYCPEWIKHRPLIPDPVDFDHPAVVEAGRKAYNRAKIVNLCHSVEEVGILLRNEIERAERNGMRISGDVISPGGWVVDNMTLDLQVWCLLTRENIRASHVYILVDSQPEWRRIITKWFDVYSRFSLTNASQFNKLKTETTIESSEVDDEDVNHSQGMENEHAFENVEKNVNQKSLGARFNVLDLLMESCLEIAKGESELDEIFDYLILDNNEKSYINIQQTPIDPFSYHMLINKFKEYSDILEDSILEESTLNTVNFSETSHFMFSNSPTVPSTHDLGAKLQIFTAKVLNILRDVHSVSEETLNTENYYEDGAKFFFLLLTLSHRLRKLKNLLNLLCEKTKIKEIDVYGKKSFEVSSEVLKELYIPFGKKPRELESFEMAEIKKAFQIEEIIRNKTATRKGFEVYEEIGGENDEENEKYEDPRIYGESGHFCIVNLERNILLGGNPKYALKYYGKLYLFWNEESKLKFIQDPTKYAPYYSPIRCLPPLRIFLLGPQGTDKSSLAATISKQCGIHFIDHIKFISKHLIPHVEPTPKKLKSLDAPLLVSEAHNKEAKKALEEFKKARYSKRQFWLENPPFYSEFWNTDDFLDELLNFKNSNVDFENVRLIYQNIDLELNDAIKQQVIDLKSENFMPMNEIRDVIENYIHKDSGLTEYCIDRSIKLLWERAPYATEGFVIKDFPLRSFDSRIILANNWIPDIVIEMSSTEQEIIDSNIERIMEFWDAKLGQQLIEEQLLEDTVKTIQDTKIMVRRLQLLSAKEDVEGVSYDHIRESISKYTSQRRSQDFQGKVNYSRGRKGERKSSLRSTYDSLPNHQTSFMMKGFDTTSDDEINEILRKEFPPLMFNPIFESYEDGKTRIIEDLVQNYKKDVAEINKIKSELQSINVPWWKLKDSEDKKDLLIFLDSAKRNFNQRGEFAFEVSMETAEKLLEQGFYFLSKFGRFCPVQAYRKKNPVNMFRPLRTRKKIFPVIYRTYIYFIGGFNEKIKFIEDPIKYTFQEVHYPVVPLRLSVIGPPKSGKSVLCKRLSLMFGLKIVTMGSAIRFVLENMEGTELEKLINSYLRRGCFLPLSLKMKALLACLNDPACATQGYVFDGIPFDAALTQSLAEKNNLPFLVFCLTCDSNFGKMNRKKLDLNFYRLPYKQRVNLNTRYKDWNKTYKKFTNWNRNSYHNLYEINANTNLADVFYKVYDIMKKPYFDILFYMEFCISDIALPLQHLCVNQQEYESRKSPLEDNCPVCWNENHRLINSEDENFYYGLVQYANYFYWVCSKHMDTFLKKPKRYLPPFGRSWPSSLPKVLNKIEFEALGSNVLIHGHGRCPVTKIDFPCSLSWEGSWNYIAFYENEVFLCKNAEMIKRFLARPWRYYKADTSFEGIAGSKSSAVENLGPPKVTSLPPIGFLEQTVAHFIHEALQVLGSVRPVYPNLTPSCTACVFVALYLKVNNKKRKCLALEKEYLDFMSYYCKAYKFRVPFCVHRSNDVDSQGDFELERSDSGESTVRDFDEETKSSQGTLRSKEGSNPLQEDYNWIDFETQADKKLWSAKFKSPDYDEMIMLPNNELQEIPDIPKRQVVIRYSKLRENPMPPVADCLTYLYSRKPNLKLPEEFNVNTLYQPPPPFVSPYRQSVSCNPDRQFSMSLLKHTEVKESLSYPIYTHEERTFAPSEDEDEGDDNEGKNKFEKLHTKFYVPRFDILDIMQPINHLMPVVVENPPIVFEPHRDYTYTILLSYIFKTSHMVTCYEWKETKAFMEYSGLIDRNLWLTSAYSQFFYKPKVTPSIKSVISMESYQHTFDAKNTFFYRDFIPEKESSSGEAEEAEAEGEVNETEKEPEKKNSSLLNFMQLLITDKLDDTFSRLSLTDVSYDSFETALLSSTSDPNLKPSILIRETLPYPPLIWDTLSRPYYSQSILSAIFNPPLLENIAHERHVSLLDGISEPYDIFRFVRYPSWAQPAVSQPMTSDYEGKTKVTRHPYHSSLPQKVYYYYDFFNLEWTAFLCYPLLWPSDADVSTNFYSSADNNKQSVINK